jgi:hypothetical protein
MNKMSGAMAHLRAGNGVAMLWAAIVGGTPHRWSLNTWIILYLVSLDSPGDGL